MPVNPAFFNTALLWYGLAPLCFLKKLHKKLRRMLENTDHKNFAYGHFSRSEYEV